MTPIIPGLHVFCDADDVIEETRSIPRMTRAAASVAIAMCEQRRAGRVGTRWLSDDRIARFVDSVRAVGLKPILCAFPCPIAGTVASRDKLAALLERHRCRGMLDAEPRKLGNAEAHWSASMLAPWRAIDDLGVTTTRVEAPRLGPLPGVAHAQAEQQTSIATLPQLFARFAPVVARESTVLVTGAFDQPNDPRTLAEFCADLDACTEHAQLVRAHAVWSAHTLGPAECDALDAWTRRVWA